ncbi:MAG: type II secretion system protein J [Planctomycetota bacterium]
MNDTHYKYQNSRRGSSIIEMMIVVTIFVLVATSIYGTLTNITKLHGQSDSNVALQIDGQKALNAMITELRTSGFFRLQQNQTLLGYSTTNWDKEPINDPHKTWDVPYLFAGDGIAFGTFADLSHPPCYHSAKPADEEYNATQEIAFIPLGTLVNPSGVPTSATVNWENSGVIGATANIVMPVQWQVVSYELRQSDNNTNELKRVVRSIDQANMKVGDIVSESTLARYVEAVRFDTAQTDSSLALYTIKITIWLRRQLPSGELAQAKMQSRVKLRNSVGL